MATEQNSDDTIRTIKLKVELSGGLEILFDGQRVHPLTLPYQDKAGKPTKMKDLVDHMSSIIAKPKQRDLFVLEGTVRPGILVLINDADWELDDKEDYELCDGDNVLFVSTLHGG